jgi:hypothetical protein
MVIWPNEVLCFAKLHHRTTVDVLLLSTTMADEQVPAQYGAA